MEEIKKIIKEIFYFIDSYIRVEFLIEEDKILFIDVKMKEPQVLIGEKGQTLIEIEKILKIVARKKTEKPIFLNLDINGYKRRKADYLKDIAQEAADEVFITGVEKKFPPMSAFERRIIHTTLSERKNIITESSGEGEERRVVVRKESF